MKHKRWIALLLVAVLAVAAMGVTAFAANITEVEAETATENSTAKFCHSRQSHKVAEPENAMGKDAAKETALADAGVSAEDVSKIKARLSQLEDGTVIYRVSFTSGNLWHCYRIDAVTGKILDKTTEDAVEHEAAKAERADRGKKSSESTEDKADSSGRGHRYGSGMHGSGLDENIPETENRSGHKHGTGSKVENPTTEEGSAL